MKHDQDKNVANGISDRRDSSTPSHEDLSRHEDENEAGDFSEPHAPDFVIDPDSLQAKHPRRHKRRIIAAIALLLITIGCVAALYYTFRPSRSVKISLKAKQPQQAQDATATSDKAPDDVTAEAIAQVRSAISTTAIAARPPVLSESVLPSSVQNPNAAMNSTVLPPDNGAFDKTETAIPEASARISSRRNHEQSIRFADEDEFSTTRVGFKSPERGNVVSGKVPSKLSNKPEHFETPQANLQSLASPSIKPHGKTPIAPVVLPSFGSVLPVRTLGKIYTLRSGSSIRLELTRYVSGEGWSLPKGTVLIGQLRGSEQDRAFVAINGFIEPSRGRLVNITGEVLGDDGGSGIRGKFHKLSSGWSRAFARVGSAAVNVAGAIAGSRISGQPVVITDIGSRTATPFSYELDSALLQQNRGFVEVPAGTAAFVMVTMLPGDVKGVDAEPEHLSLDLATSTSNAGQFGPMTEEELAWLLTSGDAARIREALPRMSPATRKIAESVLNESAITQPDQERNHR